MTALAAKARQPPGFNYKNQHERRIEGQGRQPPPDGDLYRRRMKVTRRELSVLKQAELFSHLAVAALADPDDGIVFNQPECFAPNLQPVRCAAFV